MAGRIDMRGGAFRDQLGRHVILRGVNLGGDSKVPTAPDGHTYRRTDFSDHRTVSFIGRPAPLQEIDAHLARISRWGFNCLRLLLTWEAVEHAGPGRHDEAFLDYYSEVCRRAGAHGLHVLVDFHQDAWSRMSGGDGAPGWTWEAAGMDFSRFGNSGAAHVMQYVYDGARGGRQDAFPVMSWSGNYARPANGIMWTLFFAGADLAPAAKVEGRSVQHYLQDHYLGAMRAVAERVAHLDHVIGFDTLNEPGTGYIGMAMSSQIVRYRGPVWTPLDGLALASGMRRTLPVVAPGRGVISSLQVNEGGDSIWLPGREDPFRVAGAWDVVDGAPVALREDHFRVADGREIDLGSDCMAPFFHRVADTIRGIRSDWLVFAEMDPFQAVLGGGLPEGCPERTVNAGHWYDLTALATKRFDPSGMTHVLSGEVREGERAIEDGYAAEMAMVVAAGRRLPGDAPTLLGECGIQYDMNDADSYRRWAAGERDADVWRMQATALGLMYNAIDRLLLSSTQWNYTVSNRNDEMIGDGWNQEDLSIWSRDQIDDPDEPDGGARAIEGFCRPYVRAAQGSLVSQRFDGETLEFEAVIRVDMSVAGPTDIYVPRVRYPGGVHCSVDCAATEADAALDEQRVSVRGARNGVLTIRITPQ